MNLDINYKLASEVRIEPEQFGALLHSPQPGKPLFLFNPALADFINSLDGQQSLGVSLDRFFKARRLASRERGHYLKALAKLEKLGLLKSN